MEIFDLLEDSMPFAFIAGAVLLLFLARETRKQNTEFRNAKQAEGKIISLRRASSRSAGNFFPTIEYEWFGETREFESTLSIRGGEAGQVIDIEINSQGKARLASKYNKYLEIILFFSGLILLLAAIMIFIQ